MERKIGEIFEYNGEWYQCGEGRCRDCYFSEKRYLCKQFITKGFCTSGIIFKKLEKVGEPYTHYCPSGRIIYFQRYKLFYKLYSHNTEYIMCDFNEDGIVSIEIKENKEDMEEKELNLKPFDIKKAKEGYPVCTRDGRKARIICFDFRISDEICMIAAIECGKTETIFYYDLDGKCRGDGNNKYDLITLPEKKEGWVNVYRDCDGANITKDDNIYSSREAAIASAQFIDGNHYVATTKINWEEQLWDWISNYTLEI